MTTESRANGAVLETAVVWRVWLGTYTESVLVLAPLDATLEDVARAGKVALDDRLQGLRPEHGEHDRTFWTDAVAAVDVTRIERGDEVRLHPRVATTAASPGFASAGAEELQRRLDVIDECLARFKPQVRNGVSAADLVESAEALRDVARNGVREDAISSTYPEIAAAPWIVEEVDDDD